MSSGPRRCSTCHRMFDEESNYKTCGTCRERQRARHAARMANNNTEQTRPRRIPVPAAYRSQFSRMQPLELGEMNVICEYCDARHFSGELPASCTVDNIYWISCCKKGEAAHIEKIKAPPPFLKTLLMENSDRGTEFRKHIRNYNSTFAFTSMRAEVHERHRSNMPFQIHGNMYHSQGPLIPDNPSSAMYAQLYIFDPDFAVNVRMENNRRFGVELKVDTVRGLTEMLNESNPYVQLYKSAHDILSNQANSTENNNNGTDNAEEVPFIRISPAMRMHLMAGADRRTENLPTANEIAGIIPNESTAECFRDIRIYLKNDSSSTSPSYTTINQNNALYMPLHYTLLFPHGEYGWNWGMRLESNGSEVNASAQQEAGQVDDQDEDQNHRDQDEDQNQEHGVVGEGDNNVDQQASAKKRLHQRVYYRFRLHVRKFDLRSQADLNNPLLEFPTLFLSKRLFQQYIVDAWAICDQNKLDWIRSHQDNIRADLYSGVQDALLSDDVDAAALGRRFILPSNYVGGPRFMAKQYQDSMAIVRYFGKPSLFITFTANPKWEEITTALFDGQTSSDRPDLVARVFNLKLKEFLNEVKKNNIFGKYKGLVRTIEYQKRGLPHMHMLLFLDGEDKIDSVEKIDQVISAEIPDKTLFPELYNVVTRNMIHGPCGINLNTKQPCMVNGPNGSLKCSKNFPKPLCEETTTNENGYPTYKRSVLRNQNNSYSIPHPTIPHTSLQIDNSWVVPYNPYLSARYKAHINVECCQGVQAIKYINKYVYKGPDATTLKLSDSNDEIERHLQGRYIGPTEAIWRLFEYKIHEEDPTVTTLSLHLPNMQPVYYPPDATPSDLEAALRRSRTMLMAYFDYNAENPEGEKYLYQDFPSHFVYDRKERKWKVRRKGFAIGRVPYCNPSCGDRFYLRLLLINVPGATSFEYLRTVNGRLFESFKLACRELHLIEDDQEWIRCFEEASLFSTGHSLRSLFVTSLTFGQLINPSELWDAFGASICDDLPHKLRQLFPTDELYHTSNEENNNEFHQGTPYMDYGLYLIDNELKKLDCSLEQYNLPSFIHDWHAAINRATGVSGSPNLLIREQLSYIPHVERQSYEEKYNNMNPGQKAAFDEIITAVNNRRDSNVIAQGRATATPPCFFLHGPAGTGKTFVYTAISNYFRSDSKIVLCVASSGIASLLLPGGRTSHSRFKIPLQITESSMCYIPKNKDLAFLLRSTELIIWDEVPMQNKLCFEALDRTLQDICSNESLFGGIPIVFGGDFAQIPPVVKKGNRSTIVSASIRLSYIWNHVRVLHLTQNMRIQGVSANDIVYKNWLTQITYNSSLRDQPIVLPSFIHQTDVLEELITKVYPANNLTRAITDSSILHTSAILTTRNDTVDSLNTKVLDKMPGDAVTFTSVDKTDSNMDDGNGLFQLTPEYLQTLNPGNFPPAKLTLKLGCITMLLRNLNPQKGLCNGTRLIIKEIGRFTLKVLIAGQEDIEDNYQFIPRITLNTLEGEYPFILSRKQFPVKLSFAMTINKSQGQSLNHVGIDLRLDVFTHGQLYVAFSRSTRVENIHVLHSARNTEKKYENVVYPELLLT